MPSEAADFFRKQSEAVVARNLQRLGSTHFYIVSEALPNIGVPGLNALRSKADQ